jgi:hypothetical protein
MSIHKLVALLGCITAHPSLQKRKRVVELITVLHQGIVHFGAHSARSYKIRLLYLWRGKEHRLASGCQMVSWLKSFLCHRLLRARASLGTKPFSGHQWLLWLFPKSASQTPGHKRRPGTNRDPIFGEGTPPGLVH